MIKFSIVVVSLNTKKDFLKTINSIKKQKYKNFEVIIVDGKSTDGTIELIKKINNKKYKSIIEKDKGIYDAMNKGVRLSSAQWIIFLNSGDEFYNQDILKKISLREKKNYDVMFGDTVVNNGYFKYMIKAKGFTNRTFLMPFCHQSTVVKRKLLKKFNFLLKYKISSDFDFFTKIYLNNYLFLNLNFVISKIASNGLSDKYRNKVYNENIKIIKKNNFEPNLIFKLLIYKTLNNLKNLIKFVSPYWLIVFILRIKYKKYK